LGGTNDIDRNLHGQNLTLIQTFLVDARHTNVILMGVPLRFDLNEGSGINDEIRIYIRKLQRLIKRFKNDQLIKTVSDRKLFTQHCLH
jgi:hypothetical protein